MDVIFKKHLRGQKIHTAVYLLFQILYIICFMFVLYMSFRITGSADAEVSMLPDLFHQLIGIVKTILRRELHISRNVSPKSQNILDSKFLQAAYYAPHLVFR